MANKIYLWEKPTTTSPQSCEVQIGNNGFNISKVIDGTKDSAKMIVLSYTQDEVFKPYTIVWHEDSGTWWIVSNDKVERFINDNNTFVYVHNLQLEGAIELLNARDLTDCAFNQKTYSIEDIVSRLVSLSNFELDVNVNFRSNLSGNQIVDYIKTYENYTLLTALRDLFDGYNCAIKLSFNKNASNVLTSATLLVISKTGDTTLTIVNGDNYFKDVKEIRQLTKQSYGTTVVSNAQNVVSTASKTFPTCGTANLTGKEATIEASTAMLRLPSNIFKVNWLKVCFDSAFEVNAGSSFYKKVSFEYGNNPYNENNFNDLLSSIDNLYSWDSESRENIKNYLLSIKSQIFDLLNKGTTITLYNCENWNPYNKNFVAPLNNPNFYFPFWYRMTGASILYSKNLVLCPKDIKDKVDTIDKTYFTIGWERGKDYIENFMFLADVFGTNRAYINSYLHTDLRNNIYDNNHIVFTQRFYVEIAGELQVIDVNVNLNNLSGTQINRTIANTFFVVNYIPMSDLKVKYDNDGETNNIHLYNQNGKLTDSHAFSKLLCSYKKEIESENITRYNINYNLTSHLKEGQVVRLYDETYVVNSVSLDLYQNENQTYYVVEEYTLSKNIAVKSLLTNPNTNVRDYGIPQNYNVKRKQLYRDFYELSCIKEGDDEYYMPLSKIVNIANVPSNYNEHIAVIKVNYAIPTGGDSSNNIPDQTTWYYQLNTTTYLLKKSIYEVVDFKDNNIIGYSALNIFSGFDISKLLTGMNNMANAPIQYTDDNGQLQDLYIAFCTADQLQTVYEHYIAAKGLSLTRSLYNASAFIDGDIYEGDNTIPYSGAKDNNDFLITEVNYNKDALEVPVCEYSCQIDDSKYVLVGENILEQPSNKLYVYSFVLAPKNIYDDNNAKNLTMPSISYANSKFTTTDCVVFQINEDASGNDVLDIFLYDELEVQDGTFSPSYQVDITSLDYENKDLIIFRRTIDTTTHETDEVVDLMMIVRHLDDFYENSHLFTSRIRIEINHFKLK